MRANRQNNSDNKIKYFGGFVLLVREKTRNLKMLSWALGNRHGHVSPFSDILKVEQ